MASKLKYIIIYFLIRFSGINESSIIGTWRLMLTISPQNSTVKTDDHDDNFAKEIIIP